MKIFEIVPAPGFPVLHDSTRGEWAPIYDATTGGAVRGRVHLSVDPDAAVGDVALTVGKVPVVLAATGGSDPAVWHAFGPDVTWYPVTVGRAETPALAGHVRRALDVSFPMGQPGALVTATDLSMEPSGCFRVPGMEAGWLFFLSHDGDIPEPLGRLTGLSFREVEVLDAPPGDGVHVGGPVLEPALVPDLADFPEEWRARAAALYLGFDEWVAQLPSEDAARARALAARFRALGATSVKDGVVSEIVEGFPQLARFAFPQAVWRDLGRWRPDVQFPQVLPLFGGDEDVTRQVCALVAEAAVSSVFDVLCVLDDGTDLGAAVDAPRWQLVEQPETGTTVPRGMHELHASLRVTDPRGIEAADFFPSRPSRTAEDTAPG